MNLEGNISAGKSTMSDSLADLCKQNGEVNGSKESPDLVAADPVEARVRIDQEHLLVHLLVSEAGPYPPRGLDPGMVRGNRLHFSGNFLYRHGGHSFPAGGHHDAESSLGDEIRAGGPEAGSQQAIRGRGGASPLDVAQDGDA